LYKKISNIVEKEIGGELIIVPLVDSVAQMDKVFSINEVGVFIFSLLDESISFENLLEKVVNEFDVSANEAAQDVKAFLEKAIEIGVVERVKGQRI